MIECVEPGSKIVTDGAQHYTGATQGLYTLSKNNIKGSGLPANVTLPAVHRVASLLKRWLMGTYQGSFGKDYVATYLDEFTFRFNRRRSPQRGMLFYRLMTLAAQADPLHYQDIIQNPTPRAATPPTGQEVASQELGHNGAR